MLPIDHGIMSDRSNAWYADPVNAERRKRRMRAYGRALTELGRLHAEERTRQYRMAVATGYKAGSPAQNQALRVLRERFPGDFQDLFEEQLDGEPAEGTAEDSA